jgi:hypothetical protein
MVSMDRLIDGFFLRQSIASNFGRRFVVPFLIICVRERNLPVPGLETTLSNFGNSSFLHVTWSFFELEIVRTPFYLSSSFLCFLHTPAFKQKSTHTRTHTHTMTGANKTRALVLIADGTEEMEAVITSTSTPHSSRVVPFFFDSQRLTFLF